MCNSQRSLGEKINTWLQIIAILLAGTWSVYTFIYIEYVVQSKKPAHISIDIRLSKAGTGYLGKSETLAIIGRIKISNLSERTVYLLPSVFQIHGYKILVPEADEKKIDNKDMLSQLEFINTNLNKQDQIIFQLPELKQKSFFIAAGQTLSQWIFEPKETAERRIVIYIPKNEYDSLEMIASFPAITKNIDDNDIKANWIFVSAGEAKITLERKMKDGSYKNLNLDNPDDNDKKFLESIGYGIFDSQEELPLWETDRESLSKSMSRL